MISTSRGLPVVGERMFRPVRTIRDGRGKPQRKPVSIPWSKSGATYSARAYYDDNIGAWLVVHPAERGLLIRAKTPQFDGWTSVKVTTLHERSVEVEFEPRDRDELFDLFPDPDIKRLGYQQIKTLALEKPDVIISLLEREVIDAYMSQATLSEYLERRYGWHADTSGEVAGALEALRVAKAELQHIHSRAVIGGIRMDKDALFKMLQKINGLYADLTHALPR